MKTHKLTRWEKSIQRDFREGRYKTVALSDLDRRKYIQAAKATPMFTKGARITLRLNEGDLRALKLKAYRMGAKYQTFIGDILHREAVKTSAAA